MEYGASKMIIFTEPEIVLKLRNILGLEKSKLREICPKVAQSY